MKSFVIALSLLIVMIIIGSNANSSLNQDLQTSKRESYQACLRIRAKAHYNLKCEKLIETEHRNEKIQILSFSASQTRKVNKIEEIKLREFLKHLSYEN